MNRDRRILGILIYAIVSFFLIFEMALQVSPSVMTAPLMHDFNIGIAKFGIMSSFYFYSYALMQIPVGLLYDRFNAKYLITAAVLTCSFGCFFFAFTHQLAWAAFGRFLMGMGSAFAFVGVLIVAYRWFPHKYFALLVGVAQFLGSLGALSGELPIATMLNYFSWRTVIIIF